MNKENETKQSNKKTTTTKKKNTPKKKVEEQVTKKKNTKATMNENKTKKELKKEETKIITEDQDKYEYNEDLDDEVIIQKSPKKKTEPTKKTKENIEKIERIAKEKKNNTKTSSKNTPNFLLTLDKHRHAIYSFIGGVLLTTLIVFIIWPDRIATLKDGTQPVVKIDKKTYTADDLYENMKDYYSVSLLLDEIDNDLLTKLYPEDSEMTEKISSNAEYYINMYQQYYNYTQEEFLAKNGFSSYNAFLEYLKLNYRRNKYLDNYVKDNLTDNEIQDYYDNNVFGDINTQHILVEVKSSDEEDNKNKLSDEDAKALAEEIITKLNDGTPWETIQKDYKDKVTYEDLGYQSWDASLEDSFMTALKKMDNNSYGTEPVKTSYGYHVIYRLDQKEKPSLKGSKEKIIDNLVTDKKAKDENLLYKALISLREEKGIEFSDTVMKSKYNEYCKQYK